MVLSAPSACAERELEEVRGHLGSLFCRASLKGYPTAREGGQRCGRIKYGPTREHQRMPATVTRTPAAKPSAQLPSPGCVSLKG